MFTKPLRFNDSTAPFPFPTNSKDDCFSSHCSTDGYVHRQPTLPYPLVGSLTHSHALSFIIEVGLSALKKGTLFLTRPPQHFLAKAATRGIWGPEYINGGSGHARAGSIFWILIRPPNRISLCVQGYGPSRTCLRITCDYVAPPKHIPTRVVVLPLYGEEVISEPSLMIDID